MNKDRRKRSKEETDFLREFVERTGDVRIYADMKNSLIRQFRAAFPYTTVTDSAITAAMYGIKQKIYGATCKRTCLSNLEMNFLLDERSKYPEKLSLQDEVDIVTAYSKYFPSSDKSASSITYAIKKLPQYKKKLESIKMLSPLNPAVTIDTECLSTIKTNIEDLMMEIADQLSSLTTFVDKLQASLKGGEQ